MPAASLWKDVLFVFFLLQLPSWLVIGLWLWVRQESARRRADTRHCHGCGYDLTGNVSGVCPECGGMGVPRTRLTSAERTAVALFAISVVSVCCIALVFISSSSAEAKVAATLMLAAGAVGALRGATRLLRHHLHRLP